MAKQENKGKRSYQPLLWILLYLFDVILIIFVQATVLYPYDRPITKESLEAIPYFSGCEVLDMIGEQDSRGPGYVLYADETGQEFVVELDYMMYVDKFSIDKSNVRPVSGPEYQEIEFRRLTGSSTVPVENHQIVNLYGWGSGGLEPKHYILMGLGLLMLEGAVLTLIEKVKKK